MLTRDQIANFVKDQKAILEIEKLFRQVEDILPGQIADIESQSSSLNGSITQINNQISNILGNFNQSSILEEVIAIKNEILNSPKYESLSNRINYLQSIVDLLVKIPSPKENFSIVWDDCYPSAVSTGLGSSPPSWSNYTGNFYAYEFVGAAAAKNLDIHTQLYHSYREGSNIIPHIHLYIPDDGTGGDIKFTLEYQWSNVDDTGAYSSTTISNTITRGASAGIAQNEILSFGEISGAGKKISSIISAVLERDPTDVADTFGSSVWLLSYDTHFQKDADGSRGQYTK